MPITAPTNDIEKQLMTYFANIRGALIYAFSEAADDVINNIKLDAGRGGFRKYQDQSGNLTSSVGFALVENGVVLHESTFEPIMPTAQEGADAGRNYLHQVAAQYPHGISVIVVAGMNYAAYVEAKGLGGMRTGEIALRERIDEILEGLIAELKAKKKALK